MVFSTLAGSSKDMLEGLHVWLSSKHCLTVNTSSSRVSGSSINSLNLPQGSQKSLHMLTVSPFLMVHLKPLTYVGPPFLQAAHIQEQGKCLPTSVTLLEQRYLAASIFAHGFSSSWPSLQQSLAKMASFLCFIEKSPRPPNSLGKVTVLHFTICILLLSSIDPQMKSLIILSMASHTLTRRLWHCM